MRVGVPELLARLPTTWSSGKIWSHLIPLVPGAVVCDPETTRDVDVWLWDGQLAPLNVVEPVVVNVHEAPWDLPEVRATVNPLLIEDIDRKLRFVTTQAAAIYTGAEAGRQQVIERYGVAPERIRVAPYGVDHDIYRPDGPTADALIDAVGGDASMPYVLYVGTVIPRKRLGDLRDAMAQLASRFPHGLVLVASPSLDRALAESTQLIDEATQPIAGRPVANLYPVDEDALAALMRGATALCCPSVTEGFGLPVLEAMACGTPCVTSTGGALPEVIADGGIAVPVGDTQAFAEALERILESPTLRDDLSARAHRRASFFSWERMAAEVTRTCEMALALRSV